MHWAFLSDLFCLNRDSLDSLQEVLFLFAARSKVDEVIEIDELTQSVEGEISLKLVVLTSPLAVEPELN
jgi:hypothetical protein